MGAVAPPGQFGLTSSQAVSDTLGGSPSGKVPAQTASRCSPIRIPRYGMYAFLFLRPHSWKDASRWECEGTPVTDIRQGWWPTGPKNPRDPPGGRAVPLPQKEKVNAEEGAPNQYILGEGLPPIPAKLVAKIQRGDYVDMAELLRENMEMACRQAATSTPSDTQKSSRREVPDILSWITCFGMYASVVAEKYPDRVRQLFAYQTMLGRETRRCGGKGWMAYDMMFRQQAASNPKVDWSVLNNSLYSTTFLVHQTNRGRTCQFCLETDHTYANCALAPLTSGQKPQREPYSPMRDYNQDDRRVCRSRPDNRGPCFAWNEGRCSLPYCRYRHICRRYLGDHREGLCPTSRPVRDRDNGKKLGQV